jgi:hypothetical protein
MSKEFFNGFFKKADAFDGIRPVMGSAMKLINPISTVITAADEINTTINDSYKICRELGNDDATCQIMPDDTQIHY